MIKKLWKKIKQWYNNLFTEANDTSEKRTIQLQERIRVDKRGKL